MNTTDRELLTSWVAALRSGKYRQGRFFLRTYDDNYCCLGVLCDISSVGKWEKEENRPLYVFNDWCSNDLLPPALEEILKSINISQEYLAFMNDVKRNSFPEIANYIEWSLTSATIKGTTFSSSP